MPSLSWQRKVPDNTKYLWKEVTTPSTNSGWLVEFCTYAISNLEKKLSDPQCGELENVQLLQKAFSFLKEKKKLQGGLKENSFNEISSLVSCSLADFFQSAEPLWVTCTAPPYQEVCGSKISKQSGSRHLQPLRCQWGEGIRGLRFLSHSVNKCKIFIYERCELLFPN